MSKPKEVFSFKKGEKLRLDDIYAIQGLADGDWWKPDDEDGEDITITQTIRITILIERQ